MRRRETITVTELRTETKDVLNRVQHAGNLIAVTRGKDVAAVLVPPRSIPAAPGTAPTLSDLEDAANRINGITAEDGVKFSEVFGVTSVVDILADVETLTDHAIGTTPHDSAEFMAAESVKTWIWAHRQGLQESIGVAAGFSPGPCAACGQLKDQPICGNCGTRP